MKRETVYLEPAIRRALLRKAAETGRSISDLVNAALKQTLAEDAEDLEAFAKRRAEKSIVLRDFVKALRRRGKL